MSDWVLDEEALAASEKQALDECERRIRETVEKALDECAIRDPARRAAFHRDLMRRAMVFAREVIAGDIAAIRERGRPRASLH